MPPRGGDDSHHGFQSGPKRALAANPEEGKEQKVSLVTNQYRMYVGRNAPQIYQYPISLVQPDGQPLGVPITSFQMQRIVNQNNEKLVNLVGRYIYSGLNIWTVQQLSEDYIINCHFMGKAVNLFIDSAGEYPVNTQDIDNPNRKDCQAMNQILNVIVKNAMQETGLIQVGNRPKFFNDNDSVINKRYNM